MKHLLPLAFTATLLYTLSGCGAPHDGDYQAASQTAEYETPASETEPSASAPVSQWTEMGLFGAMPTEDTTRRFIRTAQLKFKVRDLTQSTYGIEKLIRRQGGFVQSSDLQSTILSAETTPVSIDSTLETITYQLSCVMTLRIPARLLDTTLLQLSQHIEFLDYRKVQAQDVALSMLARELTQDRYKKYEGALNRQARKDTSTSHLFSRAEQADNARLQYMELSDQVKFSTITLDIYQRESIQRNILPNPADIRAYEPGFWSQAGESLSIGLDMLTSIILFFLKIWWLLLIGLAILLAIGYDKRRRNRNRQAH